MCAPVAAWECDWDAGDDVVSHSIRAVAVLADGSRLVDSVRTKAARFAPAVKVDVVQVVATVTDGDGRPVKGLGQGHFRVFEDGVGGRSPTSSAPRRIASWWWPWT